MLPSLGERFLKDLESLIFGFIWNNGPDRIKRATLIGPYDLGGINMVDIFSFKKSLNIGWIKKLVNHYDTWSEIIFENFGMELNKDNLRYFFRGNLKLEDLKQWVTLSNNNLWLEILQDWCQYNYKWLLWFNSHIKIANRTIFYKKWFEKGVHYIKDIVVGHRWMTLNELENALGFKPKLLDYLGILNSINKDWRRRIKEVEIIESDTPTHNIDKLCAVEKVNKVIYYELTQRKCEPPTGRWHKWITDLDLDLNELDWLDSLPTLHMCTTSTRLRSLGYRFMLRDVLTNNRLVHMGKVNSDLCYICNKEVETILHLYWQCPTTKRLWERLKIYILEILGIVVPLHPIEMLLNISETNHDQSISEVLQILYLITRNFIHSNKCNDKIPTWDGLITNIIQVSKMERQIASNRGENSEKNCARKWLNFMNL